MSKATFSSAFLACCLFLHSNYATSDIKMATQIDWAIAKAASPYIDCAFKKLGLIYVVHEVPWKRAQIGTQKGHFDGFFMATENKSRNTYAVFSQPFMKIEWFYAMHKDSEITPDDKEFKDLLFAANLGSARYSWLLTQYKNKVFSREPIGVTVPMIAYKMLDRKNIDVVLANSFNMKDALNKLSFEPTRFKSFVAREKPMAAYFGKHLLEKEPDFMRRFNDAIKACK